MHIASRKNKVPSADDDPNALPPAVAAEAAAASASASAPAPSSAAAAAASAASAATKSTLVVTAGGGAKAVDGPPIIAEAERGLLEEMYHVVKPLTKTAYRKAKKNNSALEVTESGGKKGKKGNKKLVCALSLLLSVVR